MRHENRINQLRREYKMRLLNGISSLRNDGFAATLRKTAKVLGLSGNVTLRQWAKVPMYTDMELEAQRRERFKRDIKFSIITPLYNTDEAFLRDMIDSVLAQTYSSWELCMADGSDGEHEYVGRICKEYDERDERIKYRKLSSTLGIAGNLNDCIEMASGEYIAILDHDDMLHPAALHDVMQVICKEDADFIYTDETTFASPNKEDALRIHFKPDYSPDNLLATNYICHFTSIKRSLLDACGWFRDGFDGAQDYELFLRLTDGAKQIAHIPRELYYWRSYEGSTSEGMGNKNYAAEAGKRAVESFLDSNGIPATVTLVEKETTTNRISYEIPNRQPLVSIIIPNYEHLEDLQCCISSIKEKTSYSNYEIIVVENNSNSPELFKYYKEINAYPNVSVIIWPGTGFNWSALNNYAVQKYAKGEFIILLNNDIEVITPDWIQEMMMHAQRQNVGMVGAKLYYPDDTIQHAGVIVGWHGAATHAFTGVSREESGYMGRLLYAQNVSAVTGACAMMRVEVFEEMGGIDETFPVGFNDVDLCMRIREAGYLVVWTPHSELYHYESKSRGKVDSIKKRKEAHEEGKQFYTKWEEAMIAGDPYYNPNLDYDYRPYDLSKDEYERRKRK